MAAIQVVIASPPSPSSPPPSLDLLDMNINTNCSTPPYITAPSTPNRPLNFFYSAPTSPRSSSSFFFSDVDHVSLLSDFDGPLVSSSVPFGWESKPGVPKSKSKSKSDDDFDEDFEFDFSGQLDLMKKPSLSSADELFDGGKIRPLKLPPKLQISSDSPKSPKSKFRESKSETKIPLKFKIEEDYEADRKEARGRTNLPNSRSNNRKGISRSLSPLRVSEFALHQQEFQTLNSNSNSNSNSGSKKWRLKDFLLFRSASEGRATTTGKDPLRKYFFSLTKNKSDEDSRNSSFRSTPAADGGGSGSVSRRRGQVSAHELHYTAKRAVSEELKKKTSLPYKHGLLGCLGLNPGGIHEISKAFGSFARS